MQKAYTETDTKKSTSANQPQLKIQDTSEECEVSGVLRITYQQTSNPV